MKHIGHVRNPLTIIAIFASITEVSGAVVLPFLSSDSQAVFVWFLVLFPFLLIILFFVTLNFNHKTLYAPSDYEDENNFMRSIVPASPDERIKKIQERVLGTDDFEADQGGPPQEHQGKNEKSACGASPAEHLHKVKNISRHPSDAIAEELVLRSLSEGTSLKYQRDMVLRAGNRRLMLDAIAETQDGKLIGVEIKFVRDLAVIQSQVREWLRKLQLSYDSANNSVRRRIMFVLVLVVDKDEHKSTVLERVREIIDGLAMPVTLEVYSREGLEGGYQ